eukprot:TRINITY_DN17720_c0_g1_i4.p1 TRINITY_DN17720_c0_g1~~TRINITY_DN17720_c0_g1_i4.p1  ORF type:complete len:508 (+),score=90.85 TRINITY_DN17720_c0_g1_i4:878-2401(+)
MGSGNPAPPPLRLPTPATEDRQSPVRGRSPPPQPAGHAGEASPPQAPPPAPAGHAAPPQPSAAPRVRVGERCTVGGEEGTVTEAAAGGLPLVVVCFDDGSRRLCSERELSPVPPPPPAAGGAPAPGPRPSPPVQSAGPPLLCGTRVRRNVTSWRWGDQDGGPDAGGVVTEAPGPDGWVGVRWDIGTENHYRWGKDGCFDVVPVPHAAVSAAAAPPAPTPGAPQAAQQDRRASGGVFGSSPAGIRSSPPVFSPARPRVRYRAQLKEPPPRLLPAASPSAAGAGGPAPSELQTGHAAPGQPATPPPQGAEAAPVGTVRVSVVSHIDPTLPRLYRLTLHGDIARLPVSAIKEALAAHCGVAACDQQLEIDGRPLGDADAGPAAGVCDGGVYIMRLAERPRVFSGSSMGAGDRPALSAALAARPGSPQRTHCAVAQWSQSAPPPSALGCCGACAANGTPTPGGLTYAERNALESAAAAAGQHFSRHALVCPARTCSAAQAGGGTPAAPAAR